MKFYTNKYPINDGYDNETKESRVLPQGTVFTIESINGNCFDMKPVQKGVGTMGSYLVDVAMLQIGFTESDYIEQPTQDR